jgi:hypothetical protein
MLDDICMDVALQAHREITLSQRPCPTCLTRYVTSPPMSDRWVHLAVDVVTIASLSLSLCSLDVVSLQSTVNHEPAHEEERSLAASLMDVDGGKAGSNIILKCSNCDQKVRYCLLGPSRRPLSSIQIASNRYAPHLSSCMGLGTSRRAAVRTASSTK